MKKIKFFLILLSGIVLFQACEKVETDPVLDMSTAVAPTMNTPNDGSSFVLEQENADEEITFAWSKASYNLSDLASVSYVLQMAPKASNFADPIDILTTIDNSYTTTVDAFNTTLVSAGIPAGEATEILFRVVASLRAHPDGGTVATSVMESATITSTFTTYAAEVVYPKLWVPGAYQGWDPPTAWYIQSFEDNGIYTGYIYYPEDSESFFFKFTSEPTWDGINYGAGDLPGTLSETGPDIELPGPGGYRFVVNTNDLTWTYELQNFGVIGEFTDWADDIDMVWDNDNNYLTLTYDVPARENNRFKFRANDDWALNYGDVDPPDGMTLKEGGTDIPIEDGSYTFHLILSGPEPMYELIKN
jgi:hypothetical protein